jgi:hypothetical protein
VCVHAPAVQASVVQVRPSLAHAVPSGSLDHALVLVAGVQIWQPLAGLAAPDASHVPAMRHSLAWSVCVHAPPWQASVVQERPSLVHAVPFGSDENAVCDTAGWQLWHALVGLAAFDA